MTSGPLSNLHIVELGELVSAPYCSRLLADLGADVIKVEKPFQGDDSRRQGPFPEDIPHPERSGLFLAMNINKRGITLDVASNTGKEILFRLIEWADILIENQRPKVMRNLGIDYSVVSELKSSLIVTSISPFGQSGPYQDYDAEDLVSFHMGGYGYYLGGAVNDPCTEPPLKAAERQSEFLAGVHGALATMGAVFARGLSGKGQHVDVSQQEAVMASLGRVTRTTTEKGGESRHRAENPVSSDSAILPTKDGHVAISPREEHLWQRWLKVMGNPSWGRDERFKDRDSRRKHWVVLEKLLSSWTSQRTKEDIFSSAQAERVPVFPVNSIAGIVDSPQIVHRGFFQELEHPEVGTLRYATAPYRFSETPVQFRRAAPLLAEHNEEVICKLLGYSRRQLVQLYQTRVV